MNNTNTLLTVPYSTKSNKSHLFLKVLLFFFMLAGTANIEAQVVNKELYLKSGQALGRVMPSSATVQSTTPLTNTAPAICPTCSTAGITSNSGQASPVQFTSPNVSGSNRLLLVSLASLSNDTKYVTAVNYGGAPMTKLIERTNGTSVKSELWYLVAPTEGTASITISWVGGILELTAGASIITSVDQSNPFGTAVSATGSNVASTSLSVPTQQGELVFDAMAETGAAGLHVVNPAQQPEIYSVSTNNVKGGSSYRRATSATAAMSWEANNSNYTWATVGVSVKGVSDNTVAFTQNPAMCGPFTIKSGSPITIISHAAVTSGTATGASLPVKAVLKDGATTVFTSSTAANLGLTANGSTGTLTWTGTIASDYNIPVGGVLTVEYSSNYSPAAIRIDYDAVAKPSRIILPTSTYINVNSLDVYNAAYPSGSVITQSSGATNYIRAVVSDPFGSNDITGLDIKINGGAAIPVTSVATSGCTRTYEFAWTPTTGTYSIEAIAKEGTEGTVTHNRTIASFAVVAPSITVTKTKTAPATGPHTINDNITYNIEITNTGASAINFLPLKDLFSTSCLQYVSSSVTPNNITGGTISWNNLGSLAPAATKNIIVTMKVVGNCDPASNTATVQAAKDNNSQNVPTQTSAVNINIDQPPVANPDSFCVQVSTALPVLTNDTDPDVIDFLSANSGLYSVTIVSAPTKGTGVVNPDKTIQFNPSAGTAMSEDDTVTFTYRVTEIAFPSYYSEATVTVLYSTTNSAPVAVADVALTTSELPVIINVLANDSDADGILQSPSVTVQPANGIVIVNADKTIIYTPFSGFQGTDAFSYQVADDGCPTPAKSANATVSVQVVDVNYVCQEGTSTISLSAVPGATSYVWTLPAGSSPASGTITTNPTITINWSGVAKGTYDICVAPTNYCGPGTTQCKKIVVNKVVLTLTPTNAVCNGSNTGSINLAVSGGIAPYTYAWTKVADPSFSASVQNPQGLTAGTYNVSVSSKYGCVATGSTVITQPTSAVSVAGVIVNENPYPTANGSVTLTVSGGTGAYSYLWDNGATSKDISNLNGGTYKVIVTDASGCSVEKYFTVNTTGGPLTIGLLVGTNVKCAGGSSGTVNLEVTGGSGSYTYAWTRTSGGFAASTQHLTGIAAGTYNVTVNDGVNPAVLGSITISQPTALSTTITGTNVSCFGESNGTVTLTVSNGTAPYTFLWNTGATTQNLTNLGPGTYNVTITDANGCTTPESTSITQPSAISIVENISNTSCLPAVSGSIVLTMSGGTGPYTYLWSNGATTKDTSGLVTGSYSVVVTDASGCKSGKTFEVKQNCLQVTKSILTGPINNTDGTYTLTYQVKLKNTGTTDLINVQATDDLQAAFPAPAIFNGLSISSATFAVNSSFTGRPGNTNLLAASQGLAPNEEGLVNITLTVTPDTFTNPYNNAVNGTATDSKGVSATGTSIVGVNFSETAIIGLAKQLSNGPILNPDGSYDISFTFRVQNFGNVQLKNVQVTDNLVTTFGAGAIFNVVSLTSSDMSVNSAFNGTTDTNLLAGTDIVNVNEIKTFVLSLKVTTLGTAPYNNSATVNAIGAGGTSINDLSQNGISSDPDNDGDPKNNDVTTPIVFPESPEIGAAKQLVGTPVNNSDGTYTISYLLTVKNTGNVPLKNVQLTDDLNTAFAGKPVVITSLSSTYFTVNGTYNGTSNTNLLTGTNNLAIGVQQDILLTIMVTPGTNLGPYNNSAIASGLSPQNATVTDISHNGLDVDPENDGPSNNSDSTPVIFTEAPKMGIAKKVNTITNNQNGTYTVDYTLYVQNMGNVPLTNVSLADDLADTFSGATSYSVSTITASAGLTANSIINYNSTKDLLVPASSTVAYNSTATITLSVIVTPGALLGPYNNKATGIATGPGGTSVSDVSTEGINPDPDDDGNPNNNSIPTPVSFNEAPQITVTKSLVGSFTNNGNNTYTLTYEINVENTGDVPLNNLQVVDALNETFNGATAFVVNSTNIFLQPVTTVLVKNPGYNGSTDTDLLAANNTLLPTQFAKIRVTVTVTPGSFGGPYLNKATGIGNSPGDVFVLDNSENVSVTFYENPSIGLAKSVVSVFDNGDGTNLVTLLLTAENFGDVNLKDLEIFDDITTQFAAVSPTNFTASEGTLFANSTWDGTAASNILETGQTLDRGVKGTVFIRFTVTPGFTTTLPNSATASGAGPIVKITADTSTDGLDPDGTNGDNNPDENTPTPVNFKLYYADLSLTNKVNNATPTIGSQITYTLTLTNKGVADVTGVTVEDILPAGLTFISTPGITAGTSYDSVTGIWDLSSLTINKDDVYVLNIVATVAPGCTSITNIAEIKTSSRPDPNSTVGNGN